MSILIKGVDMPKNGEMILCFASDENDQNTVCLILDSKTTKPIEHKGVVEVPTPHGRLIDAEALKNIIQKIHCTNCNSYYGMKCGACWVADTISYIDDAPTIIESEGIE